MQRPQPLPTFATIAIRAWSETGRRSLGADGFLVDTGERTGGNGRVTVWLPGWNKGQTKDKLSQTNSKLSACDASSFTGKAGLNPECGTLNHVVVGKALDNSIPPPPTTTTTNSEDLIKEVQKAYPRHNVRQEFRLCSQHYEKKHRPVTPTIFRAWMKRAELPLQRAKPAKPAQTAQPAGWLEWVNKTYPAARVRDYWKVSGDVQREFQAAQTHRCQVSA